MSKPKPVQHVDKLCNLAYAVEFAKKFTADSKILAELIDVPTENILGLAAQESQWGTGRIASEFNNYFSMHSPAPDEKGSAPVAGDPKVRVAVFESYQACGRSFIKRFGSDIRGVKDPTEFAKGLVKARFNSGDAKTGGRDDFVTYLAQIIRNVKIRMECPVDH